MKELIKRLHEIGDVLPPTEMYDKLLSYTELQENIVREKAREKYGLFTAFEWANLLESWNVKVTFRKFEDGEVIAIFPEEKWNLEGNLTSYIHTGQHGACSPDLLTELEITTPTEYNELLHELQDVVGYVNIEIVE